jgi:MSHA biogenesis protein MshK
MDDFVMGLLKSMSLVCVSGLVASFSWAASDADLPDPTKPAIVEVKPGDENSSAVATGPVLQSVMLRKGQKSAAMISGKMVEVGQEIGSARLIRVTETTVTLVGPTGKEILELNPGVEKKPVIDKSPMKSMVSKKQTAGKALP